MGTLSSFSTTVHRIGIPQGLQHSVACFKTSCRVASALCRCLQDNQMGGDEYTERMDAQLPEATILLFRRLAHAKVMCPCHALHAVTPVIMLTVFECVKSASGGRVHVQQPCACSADSCVQLDLDG